MNENEKQEEYYFLSKNSSLDEENSINHTNLMQHYGLNDVYTKMQSTTLPTTYHHLLRGVSESESQGAHKAKGGLLKVLDGIPFDRPIETFPDAMIKAAFQLPLSTKSDRLIYHTPSTTKDEKISNKTMEENEKQLEKKEKKKRKREKEDAQMLQKLLAPFISELYTLTWPNWIVNGKAGNPFITKITKENCKKLGVPNYFDFIHEPMDLTRMKEKVEVAGYTKLEQFTNDLKLICLNAKTFNRKGEPVHEMALELENIYNNKITTYQTTFEQLQVERKKRKKEKKKNKKKKKEGK